MGGQGFIERSPLVQTTNKKAFERNARSRKLFFNSDISDIRLPPTRVNTATGV
jgi:hypothetical protein